MTPKRKTSLAKSLLKELPYFNFTGSLVMLHGLFNNSVQTSKPTRNQLSLYDLSLFNLDSNLDVNINPLVNL